MKKNRTLPFWAVSACAVAALILTTCDSPMGMGPPVDTTAPRVAIETPADNEFMRGVLQGRPIIVTGSWVDDFDVINLRFEIFNRTAGSMVTPESLICKIEPDGKWRAEIILPPGAGFDEYVIKVYAVDKFKNVGTAEVNVRIDIVPPWIRDARVVRHPKSGFNFTSPLFQKEHYDADGYQLAQAYRNIQSNQLDEYQNETFTIKVEIEPSYTDVAASRLFVKDENDAYLHTEAEPLVPTGYGQEGEAALRFPEWEITASMLENWRPLFRAGANYISFEVRAYSDAAWDTENDRPFPGEPGRAQRIDGTVWYPESDYPHVYINPENITNDNILLEPNMDNALAVEFYDDDRLGVIYIKMLTKQAFDALLAGAAAQGADEDDFFNGLVDPADADGKRAALIDQLELENAFVQSSGDNRFQRVNIGTTGLDTGEYRLIALVKDDKSRNGYSFEQGAVEHWSVYPPVRIQIEDPDAPFIFVESPERENVYPSLTDGNSFTMSGYTLGKMETRALLVAWVPKALQANGLEAAQTVFSDSQVGTLNPGRSFTSINGIRVWKLALNQAAEKTTLNGIEYFRADFSNVFHIVNDFQYRSAIENDDKLFVINADSSSSPTNKTSTNKTFNLPGLKTGPDVEVTSHGRGAGHDPNADLTLRMKVGPSSYGVTVKPDSPTITDITALADNNASFTGPVVFNGEEWTREVTSEYILNHYNKGETRVYAFRAQDILGNVTEHTREIIMTDQPLLQSITCSGESGTYGIGATLRFEAAFSMLVRVTWEAGQTPRLKLYLANPGNNANVATDIFAEYDTSTPTGNTLFFTYTVQEGHTTNLLRTSLDAIEPNGSLITSYGYVDAEIALKTHDGSLQSNKTIQLDGARPSIVRAAFEPLTGNYYSGVSYFTNGKRITLKLTTNESVKILGAPSAVILCGTRELRAQYSYKAATSGGDVLYFTHIFNDTVAGVSNIIPMTRLEWGEPWFEFTDDDAITDMAGNDIIAGGYETSLLGANRRGEASGSYPSERGYIKTTLPPTPSYSLHQTSADAANNANAVTANPFLVNHDVYARITGGDVPVNGLGGSTLYYSFQGGNNPQAVSGITGTGVGTIPDADAANKHSPSYERSNYSVVAWQDDLAGNRSALASARPVTINSRFPELLNIEVGLPDGVYPSGTIVTFRLNFSDKIKILQYGATVHTRSSGLWGIRPDGSFSSFSGFGLTPYFDSDDEYSTQFLIDWYYYGGSAKDIKFIELAFSRNSEGTYGLGDEYGNLVADYWGTEPESFSDNDNSWRRPIGPDPTIYPFQINRPNLEFKGDGPVLVSANPALPTDSGEGYNGGVLAANSRTFTLTYDVPVTKVSGKYITVRPYGEWAVPPVLSVEEMDALLNNPAVRDGTISINYNPPMFFEMAKVLTHVDTNGVPIDTGAWYLNQAYNLYAKTTHGLKDIGGYVRPDTATKWVLNFDLDPHYVSYGYYYDTHPVRILRDVFNAAQWKQQRIHVGSQQVTVSGDTVTVTLNEALLPGRIWEVLWDDGAFQDAAGNGCYSSWSQNEYRGYRFWSAGTAAPVVRVNRVSSENAWLPADTEVRIDCETPGASIRYNLIRTRFLPAAAATTATVGGSGYNNIFVSTDTNDAAFFGSIPQIRTASTSPPHVLGTYNYAPYTGYRRNTIGNDEAKDANGFFNTLLVPREVQTSPNGPGTLATVDNGAPTISDLNRLGNIAVAAVTNETGANVYKTVNASGAASGGTYVYEGQVYDSWGGSTGRAFLFFAGEQYQQVGWESIASYDPRHFSGRRDYVAAAARKNAVSDTTTADGQRFAGPQLAASAAGTEGVYKTTVIYRNPGANIRSAPLLFHHEYNLEGWSLVTLGLNNLFVYGFDQRGPVSVVSGFPLKPSGSKTTAAAYHSFFHLNYVGFINHTTNEICPGGYYDNGIYIAHQAYEKVSIDEPFVLQDDITNNYLWTTWEIVTDWYQGAAYSEATQYYSSVNDPFGLLRVGLRQHPRELGKINNRLRQTSQEPSTLSGKSGTLDLAKNTGTVINNDMVASTYGGVTYRYRQDFDDEIIW